MNTFTYTNPHNLREALKRPPYGGLVTVPYLMGIVMALEEKIVQLSAALSDHEISSTADALVAKGKAERAKAKLLREQNRAERPDWQAVALPPRLAGGRGYVYFLDDGRRVKIGWAVCIATRMAALQTGISERLKLVGYLESESQAKGTRDARPILVSSGRRRMVQLARRDRAIRRQPEKRITR